MSPCDTVLGDFTGIAGAATMLFAVLLINEPAFHAHLTKSNHPVRTDPRPLRRDLRRCGHRAGRRRGRRLGSCPVRDLARSGAIGRPVAEASGATDWIADGDYQTRLRQPGPGPARVRPADHLVRPVARRAGDHRADTAPMQGERIFRTPPKPSKLWATGAHRTWATDQRSCSMTSDPQPVTPSQRRAAC